MAAATAASTTALPMVTQELGFEMFPGRRLTLVVWQRVTNVAALAAAVASKSLDVALLDAARVADTFTLAVAANKALHVHATAVRQRATTLHAELVLCLWAGRNLADALRGLGAGADTTDILVAVFDATPEVLDRLAAMVTVGEGGGSVAPADYYPAGADTAWLTANYKVPAEELRVGSLADAIVGRIAVQEFSTGGGGAAR